MSKKSVATWLDLTWVEPTFPVNDRRSRRSNEEWHIVDSPKSSDLFLLDTELSMKQQGRGKYTNTDCKQLFPPFAPATTDQTRRRRRCHITADLRRSAFVLSRLDYFNSLSLLAGLPRTSVEPLQRAQKAAARLVLNLGLCDNVTPALKQLRWLRLPVEHKIKYKVCTLMYQMHHSTWLILCS